MTDLGDRGPIPSIVILGAAVWADGVPSPTLARRISTAADHAARMPEAWIICSGGLGKNPPSEADVMRRELLALGADDARIIREADSHTTFENVRNCIGIMEKIGSPRAFVVTDAYHIPRAVMTFRLLGISATGVVVPRHPDTPIRRWLWYWLREAIALPVYLVRLAGIARRR